MQLRNPTSTNKNPNIVVASWGDKNKHTFNLPTLPQNFCCERNILLHHYKHN